MQRHGLTRHIFVYLHSKTFTQSATKSECGCEGAGIIAGREEHAQHAAVTAIDRGVKN